MGEIGYLFFWLRNEAIETYNQEIVLSEFGSPHLCIIYRNRLSTICRFSFPNVREDNEPNAPSQNPMILNWMLY